LVSAQDYYPFGTTLPGRTFQDDRFSGYRFTFNGQERDDEVAGVGNIMSATFWEFDARLGRRWNVDPASGSKPQITTYHTFGNKPIWFIDPQGALETKYVDEDNNLITETKDGHDRTVTVKDDQRPFLDASIKYLEKVGKRDDPALNTNLSDRIDNYNFRRTSNTRNEIGKNAGDKFGRTDWNYGNSKDNFPANKNKCNKFVYDILKETPNVDAPTNTGGNWPLKAGSWGDRNYFVKGWVVLPAQAKIESGDVAAYNFQYSDASGHVAIVTSPDGITGTSDPEYKIFTRSKSYFESHAPSQVVYRRYIGY